MNVVLLRADEIKNGAVVLTDYRAKHIVKVLNSEVGDMIRVGLLGGEIGRATISSIHGKFPFRVGLNAVFNTPPPRKSPIDLLLAFPRPIMLKRIFSQAVALGIGSIHIVNANRVEKSFWDAGLTEEQEYMDYLLRGLEQAIDTVLPEIHFYRKFKPFIEDAFPVIAEKYSHCVYANPAADLHIGQAIGSHIDRILLAIGPEGGWVEYEINKFNDSGFVGVTIGPRILKVDTAVVNIHGRIMAEIERYQNVKHLL